MTPEANAKNDIESPARRVDHVLNAIDFEISINEQRNRRPGWTPWAVYGSIGLLLWTLLSLFEKRIPTWDSIRGVLLIMFLSFDFLRLAHLILSPRTTARSGTLRSVGSEFAADRSQFALCLMRSVFILYLALSERSSSSPAFVAVAIDYGITTIVVAIIFVFTFTSIVTPHTSVFANRWSPTLVVIGLVLQGFAISGFLSAAIASHFIDSHNVRIAALVVIGVRLLQLISGSTHPPLENALIDLRRNLSLDKIDVSSAAAQLDVIVTGLKVSHVLQREVGIVLASLDASAAESRLASAEWKAAYDVVANVRAGRTTLTQGEIVCRAIIKSAFQHLDSAGNRLEATKNDYLRILQRGRMWKNSDPTLTAEVDLLGEKMDSAWTNAIAAVKATIKTFKESDWERELQKDAEIKGAEGGEATKLIQGGAGKD